MVVSEIKQILIKIVGSPHLLNHSDERISYAVGRLRKSKLSRFVSRCDSSFDIQNGSFSSAFMALLQSVFQLSPLKGKEPIVILYSTTPNAQMSAGFPQQPSLCMTYGAIQCIVPQKSQRIWFSLGKCLLNPKSIILILNSLLMSIFQSLISRWTMSLVWRQATALMSCLYMNLAMSQGTVLRYSVLMQSERELISNSSVTMLKEDQVQMVSMQARREGWTRDQSTAISFCRFLRRSSLDRDVLRQILTATRLPSLFLAERTIEQVPRPMTGPNLYSLRCSAKSIFVILMSKCYLQVPQRESLLFYRYSRGLF